MAAVTSAVVGIATGLTSAGMSFSQAAKASSAESKALKASEDLMEEAKKQAEVQYLEALNVPLDGYDEEARANLQAQQQNIQALQEGDARNLAAGVGRVGAGATQTNEGIRIDKNKELYELEKAQVLEQQAIGQDLKEMSVGAATDQQLMARDSAEAKAAAQQSAFAGVGQAATSAASLVPLYAQSKQDSAIGDVLGNTDTSGMRMSSNNPNANETLFSKYTLDKNALEAAKYAPQIAGTAAMSESQIMQELTAMGYTMEELRALKKAKSGFNINAAGRFSR